MGEEYYLVCWGDIAEDRGGDLTGTGCSRVDEIRDVEERSH
jgi:hypothetical protein